MLFHSQINVHKFMLNIINQKSKEQNVVKIDTL